jgi:transposase
MGKAKSPSFSRINQRHAVIYEWRRCRGVISKVIYRTGWQPRYILKWVKRYRDTTNVKDAPRPGRPRVLSSRQVASLAKAAEQRDSVPAAAAALKKKGVVPRWVSVKTARRAVKRVLKQQAPQIRPVLTDRTKAKRLRFCKQRHPVKQLVAVDSTILTAGSFGSRHKVWAKKGSTPVIQKYRQGQKLHVYAGLTRYGATKLFRVTGTTGMAPRFTKPGGVEKYRGVCAKEFQQVLLQQLVPQAKRILRKKGLRKPIFLLDGAPVHRAADTINFMSAHNIQYLHDWPPNSPDLNPIENVWAWLKRETDAQHPQTEAALWRVAKGEWKRLTASKCSKYMRSFNKRMQSCVQKNGGHTGY